MGHAEKTALRRFYEAGFLTLTLKKMKKNSLTDKLFFKPKIGHFYFGKIRTFLNWLDKNLPSLDNHKNRAIFKRSSKKGNFYKEGRYTCNAKQAECPKSDNIVGFCANNRENSNHYQPSLRQPNMDFTVIQSESVRPEVLILAIIIPSLKS